MAANEPFDNPLVPNARLKQMLLAMHRVSMLEKALTLKRRSGIAGLEACVVAPTIDLKPGDLVSDALRGVTINFLRGTPLETALDPEARPRKARVLAESGTPHSLAWSPRHEDRLWMALGAASALRRSGVAASPGGSGPSPPSAVVCYLRAGQTNPSALGRIFQLAQVEHLPVVFVALPASLRDREAVPGAIGRLASRSGVPSIAADREDAIAIYRVAQESLGRARAGGGPALIECVAFDPETRSRNQQTSGALSLIERYILERRIVTTGWIARETRAFARHLPHPVH